MNSYYCAHELPQNHCSYCCDPKLECWHLNSRSTCAQCLDETKYLIAQRTRMRQLSEPRRAPDITDRTAFPPLGSK